MRESSESDNMGSSDLEGVNIWAVFSLIVVQRDHVMEVGNPHTIDYQTWLDSFTVLGTCLFVTGNFASGLELRVA